ncbi:MAG: hypothetical protein DRP87_13225 [Spirochaetes bacterium]|nr:MAG: hypothetical protein DRP87_13225 [Spirochaetota bacterium]
MARCRIVNPGPLTTVQDLGRWGGQSLGYCIGGAMDIFSLKAANLLVGNEPEAAGLEFTYQGAEIIFFGRTLIAITGAEMGPMINNNKIPQWETIQVNNGDVLSFGTAHSGLRAYLAVKGGFDVPAIIGSRSTSLKEMLGGVEGRALRNRDLFNIGGVDKRCSVILKRMKKEHIPFRRCDGPIVLRTVEGPHQEYFSKKGEKTFYSAEYTVSKDADRVGYRLEGERIEHKGEAGKLISLGMVTGAVQVPGNGLPIVLTAEHRTHGGYPCIATVITIDMPKLVQCRPGDTIRFEKITLKKAQELLEDEESFFNDFDLKYVEKREVYVR